MIILLLMKTQHILKCLNSNKNNMENKKDNINNEYNEKDNIDDDEDDNKYKILYYDIDEKEELINKHKELFKIIDNYHI